MSLMRLLTAGKTLIGLQDMPRRYRMRSAHAMPKFEAVRNPFRATPQPAPPSGPTPSPRSPIAAPTPAVPPSNFELPNAPSLPAPSGTSGNLPLSAPGSGPKSPPPAAGVSPAAGAVRRGGARYAGPEPAGANRPGWPASWVVKLGRLVARPRVRAVRSTDWLVQVQGELSLDRVRVVRNDLSDADLEVVTRRPGSVRAAPESSPRPARPGIELAATGWGRVTARFFGAGKS